MFMDAWAGRQRPRRLIALSAAGLIACSSALANFQVAHATDPAAAISAWGYNYWGQLGDGTTSERHAAVQVNSLTNVTGIATGEYDSVAVKSDGTVWDWGFGLYGQLGNGGSSDSHSPVQVSGLTTATAVSVGTYYAMALKADGTVWAWGYNGNDRLGDGSWNQHSTPVQVSGLSGVTAIAASNASSMALKSDGTVWNWGWNGFGTLGDGTTNDHATATQVSGLTGVTAIAARGYSEMALKSDGTVWAWGSNGNGQLGDGTTSQRNSPVQVSGITSATAIAMGTVSSMALNSDGTVSMWGSNGNGQLGDGTTSSSYVPVPVGGLTGVGAISASGTHSLALKLDGTVWGWGSNGNGQLGDGTTAERHTPVQANGLAGMISISAGGNSSLATGPPPPAQTTTALTSSVNPSTVGQNVTFTATVSPTPDGGTVNFTDGGTTISGCGVVAVSSGVATCSKTYNAADSYSIAANYSGDSNFGSSSGSLTQTASAPTISSLSPNSGLPAGGTTVIITGTNLSAVNAVTFNAAPASGVTVNSSTQVTVTSPSSPLSGDGQGAVTLTVTDSYGNTATSSFTYGLPAISSISPTSGPTSGATAVTITGTYLSSVNSVTFGGNNASAFTVDSNSQVTATAPASTLPGDHHGAVNVVVGAPGGITATSGTQFTYQLPTVSGISPTSGPTSGATSVTITGTYLASVDGVTFGGTAASSYTIDSNTQITATSPASPLSGDKHGAVNVVVTAPGGVSVTSGTQFTYQLPAVSGISPTSGSAGTTVTITGTNVASATDITFGGVSADSFTINSNTQISAVAPVHADGAVDVVVTSAGGAAATSPQQFTYISNPYGLTSISPNVGPLSGGTSVYLQGNSHVPNPQWGCSPSPACGYSVTFGGVPGTMSNTGGNFYAIAPPHAAGTVDIVLSGPGFTTATSTADRFTYSAPVITQVSSSQWGGVAAAAGPAAGGTTIYIQASALPSLSNCDSMSGPSCAFSVDFGGVTSPHFIYNWGTISAVSPAYGGSIPTAVDIHISLNEDPYGTQTSASTSSDIFTYSGPTVTSLSIPFSGPTAPPAGGAPSGGTAVTINGTAFASGATVSFTDGTHTAAGTDVAINSPTSISVNSPVSPFPGNGTGTLHVIVTVNGVQSATPGSDSATADQFTYTAPVVTSVSLAQWSVQSTIGASAGGTTVYINGSGFGNGATVSFTNGSQSAAGSSVNFTSWSGQLSAVAPTSPLSGDGTGTVDIVVTLSGLTSSTSSADHFTYSVPVISSVSPNVGVPGGGQSITINGSAFGSGSPSPTVYFGSTPVTGTLNAGCCGSAPNISVTSPAGTVGTTVDIRVAVSEGSFGTLESATTPADQFTYSAPVVTYVSPRSGPTGGGTTGIYISGNAFPAVTDGCAGSWGTYVSVSCGYSVTFGGVPGTLFYYYGSIYATSPAGTGLVDVVVSTDGTHGTNGLTGSIDALTDTFRYGAPTVTSISPTVGSTAGGTVVTITGAGFRSETGMRLVQGGSTIWSCCTSPTIVSDTEMTFSMPVESAGTVDVEVGNNAGWSAAVDNDQFVYYDTPTVTAVAANAGPLAGGTAITITGTNFIGATAVTIGGASASFTVSGATSIAATTPSGDAGAATVVVTTPGGSSAANHPDDQFTYEDAPTITSVTPSSGPLAGGTSITLVGTGFADASAVTFGSSEIAHTIVDSTHITITSPVSSTSGATSIIVTAPGGLSNVGQFTYDEAITSTALISSENASVSGQPVTFTATVTVTAPGVGPATGTVTFSDGGSSIGVGTLDDSGVATLTTDELSVATHPITATYGGDGTNFAESTSDPLEQVVNQASTSTELVSNTNPSVFGQSVVFTATVTATAPGVSTPSGTVTFMDGITTLGTETLDESGAATYAVSSLSVASHSITAVYSGDTRDDVNTSSPLIQVVNRAGTSTTVVSNTNPSVAAHNVTFTATVAALNPGAGTPTGSVTFTDGTTSIGSVALSSGSASLATSTLTVGTHSITVQYDGDTNFRASSSASALKQVITAVPLPASPGVVPQTPAAVAPSAPAAAAAGPVLSPTPGPSPSLPTTIFESTTGNRPVGTPLGLVLFSLIGIAGGMSGGAVVVHSSRRRHHMHSAWEEAVAHS